MHITKAKTSDYNISKANPDWSNPMNFSNKTRLSSIFILTQVFVTLFISAFTTPTINQNRNFQSGQSSAFDPAACMFKLPVGIKDGDGVQCGYLTVPEDHSNPDGPTLRLAVAIIKSRATNPSQEPLVMAQGGPGGSTIETYAETLLSKRNFVPDRDIILFDQRGTKYSTPNLYCTELDKLLADTVEKRLTPAEDDRLSLEALQACKTRLSGDKIDLSAFNSLENAADIEDLRTALGYNRINLYGVSYGTLLALHYMQMYPQSLRSVILDGVVPPQTNYILNSARTMDQDFTKLFNSCKQNPGCNRAYPDLEQVFFKLVDDLNQNPVHVSLTDKDTNTTYSKAVIDGDTFMEGVFEMLYVGSIIPALPRMIFDAQNGNYEFFQRIYSILLFDRSMSIGMYYSVVCAEETDFTPKDQDLTGVRAQIAKYESRGPQFILDTCKIWNVKSLAPTVDQPVQSDVPTLLLSGGFDPITPATYADTAANTLKHNFEFVFPTGGHGQALDGDCQNSIIKAFLDNPSQKPDASCIAGISKPVFYTPANTINIPILIKVLNLEEGTGIQLLVLFLSSLLLLSAIPAIPVIWLAYRSRRKKYSTSLPSASPISPIQGGEIITPSPVTYSPEPVQSDEMLVQPGLSTFLSKTAGWVAFFTGPILAGFMLGLTVLAIDMAIKNDNRLFFGVSSAARVLFILPLIFLILSLWMLAADLSAWIKKSWSVWSRLYYTMLTLAALVCLVILATWGILTALL
jgi:pimeloyl-ACP methyl ester carboxylesterase